MKNNIEQQSGESHPAYLIRCARVAAVLATVDRDWTRGWVIETTPRLEVRCAGDTDRSCEPEVIHETIADVEATLGWTLFVEPCLSHSRELGPY